MLPDAAAVFSLSVFFLELVIGGVGVEVGDVWTGRSEKVTRMFGIGWDS